MMCGCFLYFENLFNPAVLRDNTFPKYTVLSKNDKASRQGGTTALSFLLNEFIVDLREYYIKICPINSLFPRKNSSLAIAFFPSSCSFFIIKLSCPHCTANFPLSKKISPIL